VNAGRDVERLIADWFVEEAVLTAPDRVLEETRQAIDRRASRRFFAAPRTIRMPGRMSMAAAAGVGVILIGTVFVASRPDDASVATTPVLPSLVAPSSASPSPVPTIDPSTIPQLTERYEQNGLSIRHPVGWTDMGDALEWANPDNSVPFVRFYIGARDLTGSETLSEVITSFDLSSADALCAPVADPAEITIGANRGYLLSSECGILGGRRHFLALLIAGDVAYTLHMDTTLPNSRAWFDALLASVELEPDASPSASGDRSANPAMTEQLGVLGWSYRYPTGWPRLGSGVQWAAASPVP
jgi:hypothetical protein